jgi:hypothetical protein
MRWIFYLNDQKYALKNKRMFFLKSGKIKSLNLMRYKKTKKNKKKVKMIKY